MNVLLCFSSPILVKGKYELYSFHESIINGFQSIGCKPHVILSDNFICDPFCGSSNRLLPHIRKDKLRQYIKSLEIGLIVTLNNSRPDFLEEICDCPIIILDADIPSTFNDILALKENLHRYCFGHFSSHGKALLEECFGTDIISFRAQYGTEIKCQPSEPMQRNIGFIGTYFHVNPKFLLRYALDRDLILELLSASQNSGFDFDTFFTTRRISPKTLGFSQESSLRGFKAASIRNQVIATIAPLGLELRGGRDWVNIANFSSEALWSFNPSPIYSLADSEQFYNSSRIGLNTSHDQIKTGYSWRVLDILASNGCLVTDYSSDLAALFPKHLMQFYDTPDMAKKLCQNLLANEDERRDIVKESNAVIDKNLRWTKVLPEYFDAVGLKLPDKKDCDTALNMIDPDEFRGRFEKKLSQLIFERNHPALGKVSRRLSVRQAIKSVALKTVPALFYYLRFFARKRRS